jgi:hypothetical protein
MPTFFLDLHTGDVLAEDYEGFEAADEEAAYKQAVLALVDIAKEQLCSEGELKLVATARDSSGATVFTTFLSVTTKLTRVVPAVRHS